MAKQKKSGFPGGGKYRIVRECIDCGDEFEPSNPKQKRCSWCAGKKTKTKKNYKSFDY